MKKTKEITKTTSKKTPLGAMLFAIYEHIGVNVNKMSVDNGDLQEMLNAWRDPRGCKYLYKDHDEEQCIYNCELPYEDRYRYKPKEPTYDLDGSLLSLGDPGVACNRWIDCMVLLLGIKEDGNSNNNKYINYIINKRNNPKDEAFIRILVTHLFQYYGQRIASMTVNKSTQEISVEIREKITNVAINSIDDSKYDVNKITVALGNFPCNTEDATVYFYNAISWLLHRSYYIGKSKEFRK